MHPSTTPSPLQLLHLLTLLTFTTAQISIIPINDPNQSAIAILPPLLFTTAAPLDIIPLPDMLPATTTAVVIEVHPPVSTFSAGPGGDGVGGSVTSIPGNGIVVGMYAKTGPLTSAILTPLMVVVPTLSISAAMELESTGTRTQTETETETETEMVVPTGTGTGIGGGDGDGSVTGTGLIGTS
ncbi:hypothetical protein EG329_014423 [Mollisiaceae sp. DMI_Dod_QoI]|nr:hypothetical protein EG329_014423 [Helotiales sp. DMI_Dod_QoI]